MTGGTAYRSLSPQEELGRKIGRSLKADKWELDVSLMELDSFAWSHFTTALMNYRLERWEGAIVFLGLTLEEELSFVYRTFVPHPYAPYIGDNGVAVDIKNMELDPFIKWAGNNNILNSDLMIKAHQVRRARNFFAHPYGVMRGKIIAAIQDGTVSELIPAELGAPAYVFELLGTLGSGGQSTLAAIPPGALNSPEATEKVVTLVIELLEPLAAIH